MGVVAEAVVLVFGGVGLQRDLHALAGQFAEGQAAHAEEHLAQAGIHRFGLQLGAVVVGDAGFPLSGHVFEVADQQVGDGLQVGGATVAMAAGAVLALGIVGGGTVAGARTGAVQVLAPEEELDGVVAGGDVGFGTAQLVQAGQFLAGDFLDVDLVFADLDLGVGDDVGGGAGVPQGVLVVLGDIVDQAFVQRPGVNLSFPVVDDRVAEAEGFALGVRGTSGEPGFLGGFQGLRVRLGEERVDGFLQVLGGAQGIGEGGFGEVRVVLDHRLGGGLVDLGGRGGGGRGGLRAGRRCCGRFGFLVVAAAGEGDGEGQQTGGGQGHTSHGGFLCFIGGVPKRRALVGNTREGVKKLPHNAKDLHF